MRLAVAGTVAVGPQQNPGLGVDQDGDRIRERAGGAHESIQADPPGEFTTITGVTAPAFGTPTVRR